MSEPDSHIVRRIVAGDTEAFAVLVERHHARCLRVATGLLGDSDDAEDVVQESFVRAHRHLAGYREREQFPAWLLRIVVNQCRSLSAKRSRRARHDAALQVDGQGHAPATLDAGLEEGEERLLLASALARLDAGQREAVILRFADERSYDEMAAITGVGVSALKMRVHRACDRLRTLLSAHLQDITR